MAVYELTPHSFREIESTTFDEASVKERGDLQRLLRTQIAVVVPDVLVIAEEFADWVESKRRIDLLGLDRDANLVVIELKRTEDGGHMELQAVRYAAMVSAMTFEKAVEVYAVHLSKLHNNEDARATILDFLHWDEPDEDRFGGDVRIVLVAAEFSKELTTTVMWLNEREMDVRCVRMKPYRDGDRVLVDVQQVIPLPEAADYVIKIKAKEVRERTARREHSEQQVRLLAFWTGLQRHLVGRTELHLTSTPPNTSWFGSGYVAPGITLNYCFGRGGVPRVEAYIGPGSKGLDPKISFDKLFADKSEIEGRFGEALGWERLDRKIASRIRFDLPGLELGDESSWPATHDKMARTMIRFEQALRPSLRKLA